MKLRSTLIAPAVAAVLLLNGLAAHAVELGQASVQSQRGQRLKIAVPYGADPDARPSITRFEIRSVKLPAGYPELTPDDFTIFKPGRGNIVYLQSNAAIEAPSVQLVFAVNDTVTEPMRYELWVPPARQAVTSLADASAGSAAAVAAPRARAERTARARRAAASQVSKAASARALKAVPVAADPAKATPNG